QGDGTPQARARLADEVAGMTADYVQRQLLNRRDFLMAEQAFRQEALLCPRLAELVRAHEQILLHGTRQLLQVVGSRQPEQDAQMLTAIIEQMEYQGLLKDANAQADGQMLAMLTRYLQLVLASA
ncbi:TetR family transcriptional regulator, partial [Pseudomonas sp. CrR7]|nr:TetR family transcriptional regulator [Pseudomonas sp. CM27]